MILQPLDDETRVWLNPSEYKTILDCAPHRRARYVFRLMAFSPRVGTAASIRFFQLNEIETPYGEIHMVFVMAKDSSDSDSSRKPRYFWIPQDLYNKLQKFKEEKSREPSECIIDVEKRTVQDWMVEARKNAAKKTGNEDYSLVTCQDLRRYFASHFVFRLGVDPRIVAQLGGWGILESMIDYLAIPHDVLARELGEAEILGTKADHLEPDGSSYRLDRALSILEAKLEEVDDTRAQEIANEITDLFESVDNVEISVARSKEKAKQAAEAQADMSQTSIMQLLEDQDGFIRAGSTPKIAYFILLLSLAWLLTFGPI